MSKKLTDTEVEELREAIAEAYAKSEDCEVDEVDSDWSYIIHEELEFDGFEVLDQKGGGEGSGQDCYAVFKFNGQAYKIEYSYYSHCGYEWDGDVYRVEPVQKLVTVWE